MNIHYAGILFSIFLGLLINLSGISLAWAGEWKLQPIKTGFSATRIIQASPGRVLVKAHSQWHQVKWCNNKLCLAPVLVPTMQSPPTDGIADGEVAKHQPPGLISSWYSYPTRRYDHAILGDAIEAGSLSATDNKGNQLRYYLPASAVFEDLTPRLADLDGDGQAEIITIKSYLDAGASLAIFGLRKGGLNLIASTPPIGLSHRWLNIAGIGDMNGDGFIDIAIVVTPHIGGTLEIWTYRNGRLVKTASKYGFSNHFIGSTRQELSALGDVNKDGKPEIALPGAQRRKIRIMSLKGSSLEQIGSLKLPARIVENIGLLHDRASNSSAYILGLSNGDLVAAVNTGE